MNVLNPIAATPDKELLDAVKRVDGPGSGLDADTVDGKHASDFALATSPVIPLTNAGNTSNYDLTKVGFPMCVFSAAAWNGVDTPINWEHVPVGICYMGSAECAKITNAPNGAAFLFNSYFANQAGGARGGDHIQVWFALPGAGVYVRYGSGTAWSAWKQL